MCTQPFAQADVEAIGLPIVFSGGLSFLRNLHFPLDGFPFPPIIGRNHKLMYTTLSSLSLIVVVLAVLIIKDQFSVRMATVRVKK